MATPKRPHSAFVIALRVIPFLMAVMTLTYVVAFAFGFQIKLLGLLSDPGVIAAVLIFWASKVIGMCKLHRALLIYSVIIGLCVDFNQSIGFGCLLHPMVILSILVGVTLVSLSLIKVRLFCRS